ncbi:probable aquaporin PIP2-6 [Euphorbia lathyris]|uniref:probable aquaporin PIP2-6 n=1 Tax=Euphorbia lathyris TaxID=212925 RepID=UPI003313A17F
MNNFKDKTLFNSNFLVSIDTHEFFSLEMWRATATELVATACLLFTLTISIISCLESKEADPKLLIPFTVFIIAFFFLLTTIPLSGGHMSPVFTFIAALKGLITPIRAISYILAQCIGSTAAFMVIKATMDPNTAQKYSLGGCIIDGIATETALMLEFFCCFVVLYVGVTVAFDERRMKELGLVMICVILAASMGLAIFVSIMVTGKAGYGGVGLNPARCLGSALIYGGPLWHGHWVFWVGPFLACLVYYAFTLTLPKENMLLC